MKKIRVSKGYLGVHPIIYLYTSFGINSPSFDSHWVFRSLIASLHSSNLDFSLLVVPAPPLDAVDFFAEPSARMYLIG